VVLCSSRIANAISLRSSAHSRAWGSPALAVVDNLSASVWISVAVCCAWCCSALNWRSTVSVSTAALPSLDV
jgi:hypothetical protein